MIRQFSWLIVTTKEWTTRKTIKSPDEKIVKDIKWATRKQYSAEEKIRILLKNYFLPGDLKAQIEAFVDHYNHQRYHGSLNNVTPTDIYFGRDKAILKQRERIKQKTFETRRLHHRQHPWQATGSFASCDQRQTSGYTFQEDSETDLGPLSMIFDIPRVPLALTLAGVLPFVWGALTTLNPALSAWGIEHLGSRFVGPYVQLFYGTVILSFMSGVLWGFVARSDYSFGYVLSVIPALWAFFMTGGGPTTVSINLIIGFVAVLALDWHFSSLGQTPHWWFKMRAGVTALVVLCLMPGAML